MTAENARRLPGPDALRAGCVLAVVALHAALAYAPLPWWYVDDARKSPVLALLAALVDGPAMPALFFVAGYFSLNSLARRRPLDFARSRVLRLGLPLVALTLCANPVISWVQGLARGRHETLAAHFLRVLTNPRNLDVALLDSLQAAARYQDTLSPCHLWFLGLLLGFSVLLAVWAAIAPGLPRRTQDHTAKRPLRGFAFGAAVVALAQVVASILVDDRLWLRLGPFFSLQPTRLPLYVGFTMLGAQAWKQAWFEPDARPVLRSRRGIWMWTGAALCCGAALMASLAASANGHGSDASRAFQGLVRTGFAASALLAGLGFTGRLSGPPYVPLAWLERGSFSLYLTHLPLVVILQYLQLGGRGPVWTAFFLTFLGATGLSLGLYGLWRFAVGPGRRQKALRAQASPSRRSGP